MLVAWWLLRRTSHHHQPTSQQQQQLHPTSSVTPAATNTTEMSTNCVIILPSAHHMLHNNCIGYLAPTQTNTCETFLWLARCTILPKQRNWIAEAERRWQTTTACLWPAQQPWQRQCSICERTCAALLKKIRSCHYFILKLKLTRHVPHAWYWIIRCRSTDSACKFNYNYENRHQVLIAVRHHHQQTQHIMYIPALLHSHTTTTNVHATNTSSN